MGAAAPGLRLPPARGWLPSVLLQGRRRRRVTGVVERAQALPRRPPPPAAHRRPQEHLGRSAIDRAAWPAAGRIAIGPGSPQDRGVRPGAPSALHRRATRSLRPLVWLAGGASRTRPRGAGGRTPSCRRPRARIAKLALPPRSTVGGAWGFRAGRKVRNTQGRHPPWGSRSRGVRERARRA